jgi:hypothetical protein
MRERLRAFGRHGGAACARLDELEQIGVELVRLCGGEAVRAALVDLQSRVLHELRRTSADATIGTISC